jgi:isoamylase
MLLSGDELGRTQQGNNNGYCQDNELSWLSWELDEQQRALLDWTRRVIHFRQCHPNLRRHKFFQGRALRGSEVKDLIWLRPDGGEMTDAEWAAGWQRTLGLRLDGQGLDVLDEHGERVTDDTLLILLNAHHEPVPFTLPAFVANAKWHVVFDTARPDLPDGTELHTGGEPITLEGRSLILLRLASSVTTAE